MYFSTYKNFTKEARNFLTNQTEKNMELQLYTGILDTASFIFTPLMALSFVSKLILGVKYTSEAASTPNKQTFLSDAQSVSDGTNAANCFTDALLTYPIFVGIALTPGAASTLSLALVYLAIKFTVEQMFEAIRDVAVSNEQNYDYGNQEQTYSY